MDLAALGLPVVGADRALEALGHVRAQVGDEDLSGRGEGGSGLRGESLKGLLKTQIWSGCLGLS